MLDTCASRWRPSSDVRLTEHTFQPSLDPIRHSHIPKEKSNERCRSHTLSKRWQLVWQSENQDLSTSAEIVRISSFIHYDQKTPTNLEFFPLDSSPIPDRNEIWPCPLNLWSNLVCVGKRREQLWKEDGESSVWWESRLRHYIPEILRDEISYHCSQGWERFDPCSDLEIESRLEDAVGKMRKEMKINLQERNFERCEVIEIHLPLLASWGGFGCFCWAAVVDPEPEPESQLLVEQWGRMRKSRLERAEMDLNDLIPKSLMSIEV